MGPASELGRRPHSSAARTQSHLGRLSHTRISLKIYPPASLKAGGFWRSDLMLAVSMSYGDSKWFGEFLMYNLSSWILYPHIACMRYYPEVSIFMALGRMKQGNPCG